MLVVLSEHSHIKPRILKWRNSGPYQIGHNKRLVVLSVVIISGAYCIVIVIKHWPVVKLETLNL